MEFQSTLKWHDFHRLQRWYGVVSRLWSTFSYSDCNKYLPSTKDRFPTFFTANWEHVVVWRTKFLAEPFRTSSNYLQPTRNRDAGWSILKFRHTRLGRKWVAEVRSTGHWIHWEDLDLNTVAVCQPDIQTSFLPSIFKMFEMSSMIANPILIDKEQDKVNSPPSLPTTSVSQRSK